MSSDIDLSHLQDAPQQPPRSFKPLIWKTIFILLLIVNLTSVGFWLLAITSTYGGLVFIGSLPYLSVLPGF
jgi:hypothetical protein